MVQRATVGVLQLTGVVDTPVVGLLQGLLRGLLRCGHGLLWRCQEANSRQQDVAVRQMIAASRQAGSLQWQFGRQSQNAARCTRSSSGDLCLPGPPRPLSCEAGLLESNSQVAFSCRKAVRLELFAAGGKRERGGLDHVKGQTECCLPLRGLQMTSSTRQAFLFSASRAVGTWCSQ